MEYLRCTGLDPLYRNILHPALLQYNMYLPFTSGMPEFGSDGVRCFTKDDVRGRVDGFAGVDSVLGELLARTVK